MDRLRSRSGSRRLGSTATPAERRHRTFLSWPGAPSLPRPLPVALSTFHRAQPGCFGPTTFQPPAQGGLPGSRIAVPSIASTSTSVEPSSCSPSIFTVLPTVFASGLASPHHHFGPADSSYSVEPTVSV